MSFNFDSELSFNTGQLSLALQPRITTMGDPTSYDLDHLLGFPQEIRDSILELLDSRPANIGGRPKIGYEGYQFACTQTYNETARRWNCQPKVFVPSDRLGEFITRTLDLTVLHSNAYQSVKSLFLEIPHDAPTNDFRRLAQVLKLSTQLEELHLFGVGPDGYGAQTSSVDYACGKFDTSIALRRTNLQIHGQQYHRRISIVNSVPYLDNLRVLVLDNLNMPLLRSHVLKNKPKLEKLYIVADPRTVMHTEYKQQAPVLGLNSLLFSGDKDRPPIKELYIGSNAILTAGGVILKVADTLETLDWIIPDTVYQTHSHRFRFFKEAEAVLQHIQIHAPRLRVLRLCVAGPVGDDHTDYGAFVGALKSFLSIIKTLEVFELHIRSNAPWLARDFVEGLPNTVRRFYVSDLLFHKDVSRLRTSVSSLTNTPLSYTEFDKANLIGDELGRKDFISFGLSQLGFIGYEYNQELDPKAAALQEAQISEFIKLNGRLLDKERNRHLARFKNNHIPPKEVAVDTKVIDETKDGSGPGPSPQEIEENRKELAACGFGESEYFGNEEIAEVIFRHEPAARGGKFSYPAVVEIDDHNRFCNHWMSK